MKHRLLAVQDCWVANTFVQFIGIVQISKTKQHKLIMSNKMIAEIPIKTSKCVVVGHGNRCTVAIWSQQTVVVACGYIKGNDDKDCTKL